MLNLTGAKTAERAWTAWTVTRARVQWDRWVNRASADGMTMTARLPIAVSRRRTTLVALKDRLPPVGHTTQGPRRGQVTGFP